ncbi:lytic murein transglycosylase [Sphingomonas sp. 3-13AW]|uniref:lytic murein transglycosylase n=1 Tax=Sphingomonas sp. 3-13AW TaxID=3050450 RepID=UPI003BB4B96C
MRKWGKGLLALAGMMTFSGSAAAQDEAGFQTYLRGVAAKARAEGVSDRAIASVLSGLTYNPRVVELDRGQPGGTSPSSIPAFAPYKARHVDAARISRGRDAYRAQRPKLMGIEQETGVPESIMVAIWGHETNYGGYTGNFDLPRSLATLAYEGRRRTLFEPELIATMKMVDRGVPRDSLKGSWAGATGYPQFLPSIYLRLARDGDGDGRADIWTNAADALASIGNYLVNAGWRAGQPWGVAVTVPAGLDRGALTSPTRSPRCPRVHERHTRWRTMAEWRRLGVAPLTGRWPDDSIQATLLEPDGPGKTAYLLTGNYRVILDYNCSNFYALSVGLLADEVAR